MRVDSHPIQFAAGEAIADRATCVLIAWERDMRIHWRTYPGASLAVLEGLHTALSVEIDRIRAAQNPDSDDDE